MIVDIVVSIISLVVVPLLMAFFGYKIRESMEDDGWIAVSESLPEEYTRVVVFLQKTGEIEMANYSREDGWLFDRNEQYGISYITHWMPLPEPPQEK